MGVGVVEVRLGGLRVVGGDKSGVGGKRGVGVEMGSVCNPSYRLSESCLSEWCLSESCLSE